MNKLHLRTNWRRWCLAGVMAWGGGIPAARAEIFSAGHGDVGGIYANSELELEVHLDDAGVELSPEEVTIVVPASAAQGRPAGAAYDAIGVPASGRIFKLSQSSFEANVLDHSPFLGIATEEIPSGIFTPFPGTNPAAGIGLVRLELVAVTGPGHFTVWRDFPGGPGWESRSGFVGMPLASSDGVDPAHDYVDLPTGVHEHENWAFTAPGVYDVTLRLSGELLAGGRAVAEGTYRFEVVPEPSSALLALGTVALAAAARRRRSPPARIEH